MDTERTFPIGNIDIENINIVELEDNDLRLVREYIEFTRFIQEIHQLYYIYKYNLKVFTGTFEFYSDDKIKRKVDLFEDFSNQIEINALTTNYISSGRELVDSLELFVYEIFGKQSESAVEYKKYISSIYDNNFSYRFLYEMRNFSQHGHLSISINGDKACFDIKQIVDTPHIRESKSMKELRKISEKLLSSGRMPLIVFSRTIAEYTELISKIYYYFFNFIKEKFVQINIDFNEFVRNNPNLINHKNRDYNGYLIYYVDNFLHVVSTKDNFIKILKEYRKEAKANYENERHELYEFKKNTIDIPIDDIVLNDDGIEINWEHLKKTFG